MGENLFQFIRSDNLTVIILTISYRIRRMQEAIELKNEGLSSYNKEPLQKDHVQDILIENRIPKNIISEKCSSWVFSTFVMAIG